MCRNIVKDITFVSPWEKRTERSNTMADKKTANRKTNHVTTPPNEYGKLPPQAVELEEAVLGALMLEKEAFLEVGDTLKPGDFYKESHAKIYTAIADLNGKQEPVDILTVTEQLKRNGTLEEVGGRLYLAQLTSNVASAANISYHALIISQKSIQRSLINLSTRIQTNAYDESVDVMDLLNEAEEGVFRLSQTTSKNEAKQINPIIKEAIDKMEEASKKKGSVSGLYSGFHDFDKLLSGFQNSDLIILAARPAMGKTAFALSLARNMAVDHGYKIAVFSLEMSNIQLVNRLISSETEIEGQKIKTGQLTDFEWEQLNTKIKRLQDAPIYVDDTPGLSVFELRAKCRRMKQKHGIDMILIDYLQLMTAQGAASRELEISTISRSLKGLAKELDVPVMALSQLNRGVEGRTGYEGKRPMLSDLRESGAIEQDADIVCFVHRPEYYGFKQTEGDTNGETRSTNGLAEIIVAKHRSGATDTIALKFKKSLARFVNYGEEQIIAESSINSSLDQNSPTPEEDPIGHDFVNAPDAPF